MFEMDVCNSILRPSVHHNNSRMLHNRALLPIHMTIKPSVDYFCIGQISSSYPRHFLLRRYDPFHAMLIARSSGIWLTELNWIVLLSLHAVLLVAVN